MYYLSKYISGFDIVFESIRINVFQNGGVSIWENFFFLKKLVAKNAWTLKECLSHLKRQISVNNLNFKLLKLTLFKYCCALGESAVQKTLAMTRSAAENTSSTQSIVIMSICMNLSFFSLENLKQK